MNCKNCDHLLTDTSQYCNSCGAQVVKKRLTLKNLFQQFTETYLNYDNKFFRTIANLFVKPDEVIDSYVNGVRKKYINPVNFLAISFTLSGFYLFFFQDNLKEGMDFSGFSNYQGQEKLNEALSNFIFDYSSFIYFSIIPAFAIISWIVFLNKKYNFTEHVVIYLYTMSLSSIVSIFLTVFIILIAPKSYMTFSLGIYFLLFIYHIFLLKRLFKLNGKQMLMKTLAFLPLGFIIYVVLSIIMTILIIITENLSLQDLVPAK
ncbi:DUF3667 domain-containing protein [Confluentibacter citreus]|uniref:DUF3667 domain-containing protein n=1 Tax=Confluentibacter citreus TaxID=2007307 RepID=UPI000C28A5CC|nr:DUF3667 domain-containing protein [Confluentibacter citreus]